MMLPLEKDAKWKPLEMGHSVTGAACVTGSADGDPNNQAMFVVGGSSDNSTYSGVQMYSFTDKKWETISLPSQQMQNRVNHSAIYLTGSSSIFVYAGSTDSNEDASTSTLEITTAGGKYGIESFSASGVTPAIKPALLPWDNTTAVYVGGSSTNTEVFLYHANNGWQPSGVSLAAGIPSDAGVALQSNSDGSKFLEIFDMTSSPNNVSYVALTQSGGNPAWPGEPVTFSSSSSTGAQKRDWGNLPAYNSSSAPSTSRTGFSIAQSDNGLVVITGGSEKDPVTLFNQSENSWVDTTALFGSQKNGALQQPLGTTTTSAAPTATATSTTTSATATASASASSTALPSSGGSGTSTNVIIGATLGALAGVAILLAILLLVLRCLKRKKELTEKGGRRSAADDKDRLSFQDQGIEPLTQSAVPMARSQGPSAVDSIYMISGKFADGNPSATPMVKTNNRAISRPLIPQNNSTTTNEPQNPTATRFLDPNQTRGDRSTNAGWSKYFQDTSATDVMNSHRNTLDSDISQESRSDYGSDAWPRGPEKSTATNYGLQEPRPLGLPSHNPSNERLPTVGRGFAHHGHTAQISSADSASSVSDEDYEYDRRDAFSSGIPASINDTLHWSHPGIRPPSSNYTESLYQPSARNVATTHSEPMPHDGQSQARGSSAIFHQDSFSPSSRTNINSDMSWLNIHAEK
jgi:hypothetical protein